MRQITYEYNTRGLYVAAGNTSFGDDDTLQLTFVPHDFSLAIGDDVLRSTSFCGCCITVSRNGAVLFADPEGRILGEASAADNESFKAVTAKWSPDRLDVNFGQTETVDYYPNCDGESDRWGTEWVTYRRVSLNFTDNSIEIK